MEIKITKRKKLLEINNDMCHNFYYGIWGRFYNEDGTRYRKFRFVIFFDIFDIDEYFNYDDENDEWDEMGTITDEQFDEYVDVCTECFLNMVDDYDNEKQLQNFYNVCNDSIIRYQDIAKYW